MKIFDNIKHKNDDEPVDKNRDGNGNYKNNHTNNDTAKSKGKAEPSPKACKSVDREGDLMDWFRKKISK